MCDFGLYGCGWVDLGDEIFQRGIRIDSSEDDIRPLPYTDETQAILSSLTFAESRYFKQSRLPLELDIVSHQILNRLTLSPRDIHSSLRIPAPPPPPDPLVPSVRELWEDERRRRIEQGLNPTPDMPSIISESRRGKGGNWVDEERLQTIVNERIKKEREEGKVYKEKGRGWEKWVMSTFESVEALWERGRRKWRVGEETGEWVGGSKEETRVEVEVNEEMLSSQSVKEMMTGEERAKAIEAERDEQSDDDVGYGFFIHISHLY